MKAFHRNQATRGGGFSCSGWLVCATLTLLLSGCVYYPTDGIREPNPGPTASPPWPYDSGVYPPGRNSQPGQPAYGYPVAPPAVPGSLYQQPAPMPSSPIPNSQTLPSAPPVYGVLHQTYYQNGTATAPAPSNSVVPQYSDWLVDGPEGRSFSYYLAGGYRRYAKLEDNEHDFEDAAKFLFRAEAVERGQFVEPELFSMRTLPAYAVDDLIYARQRLMAVFNRGAATQFPKLSASAQVHFDCWMEQQEENLQTHDIAQCRRGFEEDIVRLEAALIERVACPPQPAPKPACDSTPLLVLFDFNKHDLTSAGKEIVQQAGAQSRNAGNVALVVAAHTDRAGAEAYNMALSKRRLDTVIAALEAAGVSIDKLVRSEYFGEAKPRVDTPDGKPNPDNRRVEIRLACNVPALVVQCDMR